MSWTTQPTQQAGRSIGRSHQSVNNQAHKQMTDQHRRKMDGPGRHQAVAYPEEAYDGVIAEIVLVPESEERVDEMLLGAALLEGLGVLLHDLHGEAVAPFAVGFEDLLVDRGQPPQPRDVLRDGEGRADLDAVVNDPLELAPLLVQLAGRVHEPLTERQPRDVVEGHHREVVFNHQRLPFIACV